MDPVTGFVVAMLMMLLNGGILGLVHRDLPPVMRPSANDWRVGTLLMAGGSIVLAVQNRLPLTFAVAVGNGMFLTGLARYWRGLRRFDGLPDTAWMYVVPTVGTLGVALFAVWPSIVGRVIVATTAWQVMALGCALTLMRTPRTERAVSRSVLGVIFVLICLFMLARVLVFVLASGPSSVIEPGHWINVATPLVVAVLPVIGTTAFLLMCSERLRRDLERVASTDSLTGLANRRALGSEGEARMTLARQHGDGLALALVDVDHFKAINDHFGHDIGDAALKHVAARLQSVCRERDLPARQGGEEFVIVFDHITSAQAVSAADRLRTAVEASAFATPTGERTLTVSIGVAVMAASDQAFDDLLRRADAALYEAKRTGRNRVVLAA
jgi:diguanylate cyclase (GGDEF)-like protein